MHGMGYGMRIRSCRMQDNRKLIISRLDQFIAEMDPEAPSLDGEGSGVDSSIDLHAPLP